MPTIARFVVCVLLFTVAAAHARGTVRAQVDGIASAIETHYFDAARGREIADGLRKAAAAGTFDGDTDPEKLAAALNARLQSLDHHLRVRWSPEGVKPPERRVRGPMRPRSVPRSGPAVNAGTGIRGVEVLPGNVGYLALVEFADFEFGRADQPARVAIDAALQRLAGTDAMIIDVRGNRGGSPRMVGYLVSAFVKPGADVYNTFHTRNGAHSEAPVEIFVHPRTRVPLYVLIDSHTGSAAESFAYTLQGAGRAVIVGEASGGAANPGEYFTTPDGFAVFVPTGSPINPVTQGNWEGEGVKPDVPTAPPAALDTALRLARKADRDAAQSPQGP